MIVLDYLLEPIGITLLLYYYFSEMSLIVRLFTQDSIHSSIRYLLYRLNVQKELSHISSMSRYTFYILLSLFYYLVYIFTWGRFPMEYLYFLFSIVSSPVMITYILESNIWFLEKLEMIKRKVLNYLACVCLSSSINGICRHNLGKDPKVQANELTEFVMVQNMNYIWTFLKILLITTLMKYFEKTNYYSGLLLRYFYETGRIIDIPQYHRSMIIDEQNNNPKDILIKIVNARKWHYLYDPTVLNLIIKIYQEQENSIIKEYVDKFQTRTLQFFALWTLNTFIPLPFLAFLFRLREKYPSNLIMPGIDVILICLYPNYVFWISLISEYSYYLNNPLSRHLMKRLNKDYMNLFYLLFHKQKYNYYLLTSIFIIYYTAQIYPLALVSLPFIVKYNFVYIWLVMWGIFSNYSFFHLLILNTMLYIIINILDYKNLPKKKINLELIESYYRTLRPSDIHHLS